MTRIKIIITVIALATVIVAGLHLQGTQLAFWSVVCVALGVALNQLWKLKKVNHD
jgi:ABC-type uncharacterized transport system permease subunit